ncbi:MAG: class I SAM-dependent methyltransferase [Saprospiraceae bacterium]|nr:class I SAM-dependent methyltransferase [Candidatus Vicinibacter affinis]
MASNKPPEYIHGFTAEEQVRLIYQNQVLSPMIYAHTDLSKCKRVLKLVAGVGAQMIEILKLYPGIHVTGLDISEIQIAKAKENLAASGFDEAQYDLWLGEPEAIPEPAKKFDAVILVWVLEHVRTGKLLEACKKYLKTHARIHLTEGVQPFFDLTLPDPPFGIFGKK